MQLLPRDTFKLIDIEISTECVNVDLAKMFKHIMSTTWHKHVLCLVLCTSLEQKSQCRSSAAHASSRNPPFKIYFEGERASVCVRVYVLRFWLFRRFIASIHVLIMSRMIDSDFEQPRWWMSITNKQWWRIFHVTWRYNILKRQPPLRGNCSSASTTPKPYTISIYFMLVTVLLNKPTERAKKMK